MKKILSLILVFSLLLLLVSCGKEPDGIPDGMKPIENENVSYTMFIPEDWIEDLSIGITSAKTSDNSNVSMQMMTPSGSYASADAYFRTDYFPKLESTFKSVVLLEEECSITNQTFGADGLGAVKYVYTVESDGATYKIMQYFMVNAGYLYIFTYTAQESLFAEHLEDVSMIVKNFVF